MANVPFRNQDHLPAKKKEKKKPEENYNVITSDICCLQQLISKKTLNKVGYVEHLKIQIQIPLSQFNKF